jgi:uncharacterized protein (TIGR02145 family)
MGTATILGTEYQTVVMPDGKEWMAANLAWTGAGQWWDNGASDDGDGRYYDLYAGSFTRQTINSALLADGGGWRLPTADESSALHSAIVAIVGAGNEGGALKSLTGWDSPNTGATDQFGFGLQAAGRKYAYSWEYKTTRTWLMLDESEYAMAFKNDWGNYYPASNEGTIYEYLVSVRLVRDYAPPSDIVAESHENAHVLALEWTEAADGTPVAYDDGAAYDYIESTITARMTPDELTALETAWQSSSKLYTIYSTGYLLGPLVDMSAGVEVRLMSYQVDQSADSAMTLYDVTIGVHYGPLSAPSAGSLAVVQSRGRPYHSVAPGAASWITEGGTSDVNAYGRASERSCTWYTHSLTTAQAADVVNALRTLRGSSTTWTAGGVATPWGPSESGTATVWIPEWSVHRESNLLWGVQMELVRNG